MPVPWGEAVQRLSVAYLIRDRYGRPGKDNDKGAVEGLVGWARRNFMVPLPRFGDFETMDRWLEQRYRDRGDRSPGHGRLARESTRTHPN